MLKIGLANQWVNLEMESVSTPTSSYLFLQCVEGLSSLLRKATKSHQINGITSCKGGVKISHLFFVDDSLIFNEAKTTKYQILLNILAQHEEAFSQAMNRQKTYLFFSCNTRQENRKAIQGMLGAQILMDCEKYLGLPMVGRKSRVSTFKEVHKRMSN